jgi:membrane protease subunit HflK
MNTMFENPWDFNSEEKPKKSTQNKPQNYGDELDKIIDFFKKKNNSSGGGSYVFIYILIALGFVLWLSSGFFVVDADQEGVIMRFGKYSRDALPGLRYKFPSPIETVEKVSVTRIKRDVIGKISNPIGVVKNKYFEMGNGDVKQSEADLSYPKESQMLTGDENIIDMHFFVQWKIGDPKDYLFNIKDNKSDNIVRTAAESIMRHVIGEVTISDALSERRLAIEQKVKEYLQKTLDLYGSGIEIVSVGILYSYVSPEVRDAYRDVQSAKADRERYINQAQAYSNEVIPKAKGEASIILESAQAYRKSSVAKAEGDAERFNEIYRSYSINKDVTKRRMYLDTMEKVYKEADKIIIDKDISKGTLPFLPLNKLNEK